MKQHKRFRERGRPKLSKLFQEFKIGESVALVNEPGSTPIPRHFQGLTGTIIGKCGNAFIVRFLNGKALKTLVVKSSYIKKFKQEKKK
jgi:ribosomal protein L21E